jgi:hypothetical protein
MVRVPDGREVAVAATEVRYEGGALLFVNADGVVVQAFGPRGWIQCWEHLPGLVEPLAVIDTYTGEE